MFMWRIRRRVSIGFFFSLFTPSGDFQEVLS